MGEKYPRLRSEKFMTAYLGYEVDELKNKIKNNYCWVLTGFRLTPKGNWENPKKGMTRENPRV